MLFGFHDYGTAADCWAIGCLIATVVCGGATPWHAGRPDSQISGLASVFGTERLLAVAARCGAHTPELEQSLSLALHISFRERFVEEMRDPLMEDLMFKLLDLDWEKRCTVAEALAHPFLAD